MDTQPDGSVYRPCAVASATVQGWSDGQRKPNFKNRCRTWGQVMIRPARPTRAEVPLAAKSFISITWVGLPRDRPCSVGAGQCHRVVIVRPRNEDRSMATLLPKPPGNLHPLSRELLALDEVLPSHWKPVCIETLRDNGAFKMTALVQRGAPRDFLDIYHLCTRDVMSMADCWRAFTDKDLG